MEVLISKEELQDMIWNALPKKQIALIGRALVVLFNNQTKDERDVNNTHYHNGIGFRGTDARSGCITAKYYLKHKNLLPWQVEMWMKPNKKGDMRIAKYWKQINAAAVEKADAQK